MEFLASIHPMVVHFPIVLLMLYSLFEVINVVAEMKFLVTAHVVLLFGVITGVFAVLSGNMAADFYFKLTENNSDVIKAVIENHEMFASILLWYFLFLLVARTYYVLNKKLTKKIMVILAVLSLVGLVIIYYTGFYGGELVFKYGIGTDLIK